MVEIASEPFQRTYVFSLASFTSIIRLFLIIITIVAPFFIVYSSGSKKFITKTSINKLKQITQIFPKLILSHHMNITLIYKHHSRRQFLLIYSSAKHINQLQLKYFCILKQFTERQNNSLNVEIQYPKMLSEKVK